MRKILLALITVIFAVCCAFTFSACDKIENGDELIVVENGSETENGGETENSGENDGENEKDVEIENGEETENGGGTGRVPVQPIEDGGNFGFNN